MEKLNMLIKEFQKLLLEKGMIIIKDEKKYNNIIKRSKKYNNVEIRHHETKQSVFAEILIYRSSEKCNLKSKYTIKFKGELETKIRNIVRLKKGGKK